MGRPLSLDLRERAIARVQAGETTRSVAEALGIAPSSVTKWWQRYKTTGSVSPGQMGGHKPKVLIGAIQAALSSLMKLGPKPTCRPCAAGAGRANG